MNSSRFYEDLPAFSDFRQVTSDSPFRSLPPDWKLVVADIEGSTRAIEAGRYKDVNVIGAATIAAAQNAMAKRDFPFVFGGDGATLLVPADAFEDVADALDGVRALAREKFHMALRVGAVDVSALYADGFKVEVAKFELFAGRCVASFRGGGLSAAEKRVKGEPGRHAIAERGRHRADLTGLSCRWKPIPSGRGSILSILIEAGAGDPKSVYDEILARFDTLFNGDLFSANPVHLSTMEYQSIRDNLRAERRYHGSVFTLSFLKRAFEILACDAIFRLKLPAPTFDAKKYAESMSVHSDFRKFDDILRLVIDCSAAQAASIRALLEQLHSAGRIRFGLHESPAALMTCFVYDVHDGNHIHFVDGGDGGYAMAAKQLKAQAAAAATKI